MSTASFPAITGWGFYDIGAEAYHADPAPRPSLSSGLLAEVVTGTLATAYQGHPRLGPPRQEDDNKRFDLGTIAHTLVLGKGRTIDVFDGDNWVTKAAKEFRAAAKEAGRSPVLARQHEDATAMRTALFQQLATMPGEEDTFQAENAIAEQAGFWQEPSPLGKLWGRALFDWRRTDRLVIRDYKTFAGERGADPDAFFQSLIRTGKDVQGPWYSRGLAAIVGDGATWADVDFKFVVQEPSPPYLVSVVAYHDPAWSNERLQWAIDRWAAAAGANLWRGFIPEPHLVAPPVWARTAWEQRMIREWEGEQLLLSQGRAALALKEPDAYRAEAA